MRLGAKLVLFVLMTIFAMTAQAQIAVQPPVSNQPVCIEKADAYKLALADMQNVLEKRWDELVTEGRCSYLPAQHLYTIDTYKDYFEIPSRVIELLVYGERVWGIRGSGRITNVWTIAWDGVKTANSEWYEKQNMNPEIQQRLGVSWKSCCNNADVYKTQFRVNRDNAEDEWWFWHKKELVWKLVPSDAVQTGTPTPTGEPVMFVYQGVVTCFFPGEGGI